MPSNKPRKKRDPKKGRKSERQRERERTIRQIKALTPGTVNGNRIAQMMIGVGERGNPKDYVVIVGDTLVDWTGSWNIVIKNNGGGVSKIGVSKAAALVHKSRLDRVIGPKTAGLFWRPGVGRIHRGKPPIRSPNDNQEEEQESGQVG